MWCKATLQQSNCQVTAVSKKREDRKLTDATFKKEERAREGTKAMKEYEAEARATLEKTARLRALRLAKEAAEKHEEVAAEAIEIMPRRRMARSTA
jgi:hypothetical protein